MPLPVGSLTSGRYFTVSGTRTDATLHNMPPPGVPLQVITLELPYLYCHMPLSTRPGIYVLDVRLLDFAHMSKAGVARLKRTFKDHLPTPPPAGAKIPVHNSTGSALTLSVDDLKSMFKQFQEVLHLDPDSTIRLKGSDSLEITLKDETTDTDDDPSDTKFPT